jgi:hypothetical protein
VKTAAGNTICQICLLNFQGAFHYCNNNNKNDDDNNNNTLKLMRKKCMSQSACTRMKQPSKQINMTLKLTAQIT